MSWLLRFIPALVVGVSLQAATLVQLSMDQMTQAATAIVHARVASVSTSLSGSTIYTHYRLSVSEIWKGTAPAEVVLPGGDTQSRKQSFPGVPELKVGEDYVLFLWTSPSTGVVHALGLTQGIFEVGAHADGSVFASRRQTGELMLDASGKRVSDQPVSMPLATMKARVRSAGTLQ